MSRQQISYMVPEPLEPLSLEEVKFWLRIMQEHALFIKAGLPCDQSEFIDEAQAFDQEFESLRLRADGVKSDKKFNEVIHVSHVLVKEFYVFKRKLLHMMLECELGGWNFPLLLDHMAREAEYFMRLLDKLKCSKTTPVNGGNKALENTFWLRIMADHAKFISHLLDPSERNLISTAVAFSEEFDNLYIQGRDFSSMLHCYHEVASFKRFMQDVRAATLRLRDFKRAAEEMIAECRLVGLIPELLADHVRREADHFLILLVMMEKGIMKNMPVAIEELDDIILPTKDIHKKCKVYKVMKSEREDEYDDDEDEEEEEYDEQERDDDSDDDDSEEEREVLEVIQPIIQPVTQSVTQSVAQPDMEWMVQEKINSKSKINNELKQNEPSPKSNVVKETVVATETKISDTKYKWSGKWPRQLGNKGE